MGSPVGTFNDEEVAGLDEADRNKLKQHAVDHLFESPDIRAIIEQNPRILTTHESINPILREKLNPVLDQMKNK